MWLTVDGSASSTQRRQSESIRREKNVVYRQSQITRTEEEEEEEEEVINLFSVCLFYSESLAYEARRSARRDDNRAGSVGPFGFWVRSI